MKESIDIERIINYWIESAEKDFKTMNDLYETKKLFLVAFYGAFSNRETT